MLIFTGIGLLIALAVVAMVLELVGLVVATLVAAIVLRDEAKPVFPVARARWRRGA